jgi:hypothetical protein
VDRALAGAAPYLRDAAGGQVTRRPVKSAAIMLGLFALVVYVVYIAWIGLKL